MSTLRLLRAIDFAAVKHRHQRRKSGEHVPYINHPIAVARLLAEVGGVTDVDVLMAAVLHDTIEDTETTGEEIEQVFGSRVRELVEEVTDDKSLPKDVRKHRQIDDAPHKSPGAALIKLADKISNIGDIARNPPADWSPDRIRQYIEWGAAVVAALPPVSPPLAARFAQVAAAAREAWK